MMNPEYIRFLAFSEKDRLDLFLGTATRLGTSVQNVEKDFWVCWTLDALYNGLPTGGPRLLFKGGTSLSKGHGLISRFSEDIDITVFREDLHQSATVEQLEKLGTKARSRKLDAIREACSAYITGPLRNELERLFREMAPTAYLRVEPDAADREQQSLLLWYPRVSEIGDGYVGPAVKIEAGAKSALDPHHPLTIRPYLAEDLKAFNLDVPNLTTVAPARTLWDKVVKPASLAEMVDGTSVLLLAGLTAMPNTAAKRLNISSCSTVGPIAVGHANFALTGFSGIGHQPGAYTLRPYQHRAATTSAGERSKKILSESDPLLLGLTYDRNGGCQLSAPFGSVLI